MAGLNDRKDMRPRQEVGLGSASTWMTQGVGVAPGGMVERVGVEGGARSWRAFASRSLLRAASSSF